MWFVGVLLFSSTAFQSGIYLDCYIALMLSSNVLSEPIKWQSHLPRWYCFPCLPFLLNTHSRLSLHMHQHPFLSLFFLSFSSFPPKPRGMLRRFVHQWLLRHHRWAGAASAQRAKAALPVAKEQEELADDFVNSAPVEYIEEESKHPSWSSFLKLLEQGREPSQIARQYSSTRREADSATAEAAPAVATEQAVREAISIQLLVRAHQINGHRLAQLDPLNLHSEPAPVDLDPVMYGFSEDDLDRTFQVGSFNMSGFLHDNAPKQTLRTLLERVRNAYCGTVGYEYMHIPDREKCNWIRDRIERPDAINFSQERKRVLLDRLAWSDGFESFLSSKYSAAKRFGLEGCETLIPGMKEMIDKANELGVDCAVIGMPHRGRLNVLANVVRKPLEAIFNEFRGGSKPPEDGSYTGTGDVKYHLGTSYDRPTRAGGNIHLSLVANPSHLEAVDTVVQGKTRAKQHYRQDLERSRNLPVLIHGDGSFSGQGVVYESLDMSALPDYTVGGTVHLIVNNQVAFTTDPKFSRSSTYCTDVAKALNAPIFHVNGDDAEAVAHACQLAVEWRQRWKQDAVVDIVCYRRHGHNEIDEPMFTQPVMYKSIKQHKSAFQQYAERLVREGAADSNEPNEVKSKVRSVLENSFQQAKDFQPKTSDWLESHWEGFKSPFQLSRIRNTGVERSKLEQVGRALYTVPQDFSPHKQIKRVLDQRQRMIQGEESVDWATAEALAFGTLVLEGNHVRVSGQDSERGTFSQRHAVIHDQNTGRRYKPLGFVYDGQPYDQFMISNSSLSEYGVLGFEHGFSTESPNSLVCWEAQFGDFCNGAQVIIDQFIASGEAKWLRQSGLVLLLPHGYDGQGPEHSSGRLERFLQLSDEDPYTVPEMDRSQRRQIQNTNLQVCNATTPANYFHLLRRQIHRDFRKPLVIMSPKNLLRHPDCRSPLEEFDDSWDDMQGVRFRRLIMDKSAANRQLEPMPDEHVERLVLCQGKVYYELDNERDKNELQERVKICRIEQLAPFPFDLVMREMKRYPNAEIVWCQEEPNNMGAWWFVAPRLDTSLRHLERHDEVGTVKYVGRPPSASPATGFHDQHNAEQEALVKSAVHPE